MSPQKSVIKRFLSCLKERRIPVAFNAPLGKFLIKRDLFMTSIFGKPKMPENSRILYASSVGKHGKPFLEKIIKSADLPNVDFLIFVYDETPFDEPTFHSCRFIYEKGTKWPYLKKYLTPSFCKSYDYLFFWDDDIEIKNFSFRQFIEIMRRNALEMAQPALTRDSFHSTVLTLQVEGKIGRFTDFVEIMVPVFTQVAWSKFWEMMAFENNLWGWGYDLIAKSFCRYQRMGIIDNQTVKHTRPVQSHNFGAREEMKQYLDAHQHYRKSARISSGYLK